MTRKEGKWSKNKRAHMPYICATVSNTRWFIIICLKCMGSHPLTYPCFLIHKYRKIQKEGKKFPELIFCHRELFFWRRILTTENLRPKGLFCLQTFHLLRQGSWMLIFNLCYPKIIYKSCETVSTWASHFNIKELINTQNWYEFVLWSRFMVTL